MRARVTCLALLVACAGAGCGGDDEPVAGRRTAPAATSSASPASVAPEAASSSASPYLPVPDGVALTQQGTPLGLGTKATVAWQPRQDTVGVLDVTVDRLEKTTLLRSFVGWKIPEATKRSTPYFVHATITNRGATDLSAGAVPLYAVAPDNTLIEATTFASAFKPCPDGVFPAAFGPTTTTQVCLVYFVPGRGSELAGVSFRPTQEFNPITWTGEVTKAPRTSAKATTP